MKKGGLLILSLFLMLSISLVSAQVNSSEETARVNEAYSCLTDKVSGNCASLTAEEKAFSLLSINQCQSELLSDSLNSGECWSSAGSSTCNLKTTAQAVLALDSKSASASKAETWLLSQNRTPTELVWYLEIEASAPTTCNIQYGGETDTITINEEKKINSNAGSCLLLAQDDYWLRVSPTCYDMEFTVSCDQAFLTTTLFKKSTSSTIHVSEKTSSAASGGSTKEKVESYCFAENNLCDYEGSLWSALVLNAAGEDISAYLPYLITLADENPRFLPEAFLYMLTQDTEYKTSLLLKQKSNQWWAESGDRYFDTALALYPFHDEDVSEKETSKEWLLGSQDSEGCWGGNVRNTGFILASVWPKTFGGTGTPELDDCEDAGFFCTPTGACEGDILSEYSCPSALSKCCDTPVPLETCSELGGEICSSNQICTGGTEQEAADTRSSEVCCVEGSCNVRKESSQCESNLGVCRSGICNSNEETAPYSCDFSGDVCCVLEKEGPGGNYLWIWILVILIILVVVGIIFRNKLRMFWMRIKPGKSKPGPGPRRPPHLFPPPTRRPVPRFPERRILLPGPQQPPSRRPAPRRPSRAQKELDDVLKKLKDMGK